MADLTVQQGSLTPALTADLTYSDGTVLDLTGYTVTVTVTMLGAGTPTVANAACTIVDAALGRVRYQWTSGQTALAGTYLAVFTATSGLGAQTIFPESGGLTVQVAPQTTAYPTVADIVRDASMMLGDLWEYTVASAGSSSALVIDGLNVPDGHFAGGTLSIVTATSPLLRGVERTLVSQTGSAVVTDAFPTVPSTGDTVEIRDIAGHSRDSLKRFVAASVRELRSVTWVESDTTADPLDYSYLVREYPVPPEYTYLTKVLWQDTQDESTPWYELPRNLWRFVRRGYVSISKYNNFSADQLSIPDGVPLAFAGVRRPSLVSADSDLVEIDQNFATQFAVSCMALALMKGDDANEMKDKYLLSLQEVERIRKSARERLPTGARRV